MAPSNTKSTTDDNQLPATQQANTVGQQEERMELPPLPASWAEVQAKNFDCKVPDAEMAEAILHKEKMDAALRLAGHDSKLTMVEREKLRPLPASWAEIQAEDFDSRVEDPEMAETILHMEKMESALRRAGNEGELRWVDDKKHQAKRRRTEAGEQETSRDVDTSLNQSSQSIGKALNDISTDLKRVVTNCNQVDEAIQQIREKVKKLEQSREIENPQPAIPNSESNHQASWIEAIESLARRLKEVKIAPQCQLAPEKILEHLSKYFLENQGTKMMDFFNEADEQEWYCFALMTNFGHRNIRSLGRDESHSCLVHRHPCFQTRVVLNVDGTRALDFRFGR